MAPVTVAIDGHVAVVTIDRPETSNALDPESLVLLADAWVRVRDDEAIRVALLTGVGATFCSGVDLGTMMPLTTGARPPVSEWDHRITADPLLPGKAILRDFDPGKPVIAAVNGHAVSGGMEMLEGTDIRIAVPGIKLGLREVEFGVMPAGGSTVRLPRQIPFARAMEMMLTAELIDVDEALRLGLVNRIVSAEDLLADAMRTARRIAGNAPLAVRMARRSARASWHLPEAEALELERELGARVFASQDAREGSRAFLEKRPPEFRGT